MRIGRSSDYPIPAAFLRLIKSCIRDAYQLTGNHRFLGETGQSDADGDMLLHRRLRAETETFRRDALPDGFGHLTRLGDRALRQDNHKFLAPVASDEIH